MSAAELLREAADAIRAGWPTLDGRTVGPRETFYRAVADWLDSEARGCDVHAFSATWQIDDLAAIERGVTQLHHHAITVATAYLNREPVPYELTPAAHAALEHQEDPDGA